MSRRDDRDRSRTRRRRGKSPSSPPRKARRRDHDTTLVSDGMDWTNPMTWQHNPNYNPPNSFPMSQNNYLQNPSSSQLYQHPPVNYMTPFPPEPAPAKTVKTMMAPPGNAQGHPPEPAACTWLSGYVASATSENMAYPAGRVATWRRLGGQEPPLFLHPAHDCRQHPA